MTVNYIYINWSSAIYSTNFTINLSQKQPQHLPNELNNQIYKMDSFWSETKNPMVDDDILYCVCGQLRT